MNTPTVNMNDNKVTFLAHWAQLLFSSSHPPLHFLHDCKVSLSLSWFLDLFIE